MNTRTILISLLILLIFIHVSSATPQFPHKNIYCFNNCHGERGYSVGDNGGDDCGNCHTLYINNPNFIQQHEPKTCKVCHNITNKDSFHSFHTSKNISCSTCHIDNTIPDNTYSNCLGCHIPELHTIHENKSCKICHEITIPQKIVITENTTKNISLLSNNTKFINTTKTIVNYKKITIYEILSNLYRQIRDDIK